MYQHSTSKQHGFYGEQNETLVIDANPFRKRDIYLPCSKTRGIAASVVLGTNGQPIALPLQRGIAAAQQHNKHTIAHPAGSANSLPLETLLEQHHDASVMIDVAGTSPRLTDTVTAMIENQVSTHRVCCGSRFDAVGEALLQRLPQALHFMPRATRARLTLSLMLDSNLPDVSGFSVINLPMIFEGMKMVTPTLIERMNRMGIRLNVISSNELDERIQLAQMSIDALIVNLAPSTHARPGLNYSRKTRFPVTPRSHQPICQ